MKAIQQLTLVIFFGLIAGCATMNETSSLAGKWKLTESLADPGDGSGKWNAVTNESYLTFNTDGSVSSTDSPNFQTYKVLDSVKLEFTLNDGRKQVVSYKTEGSTLTLTPQCIEACGSKYVKVN